MRFQFNPNLDFQKNAIDSVVGLLEGQPYGQQNIARRGQADFLSSFGVGNTFVLSDDQLLANTHKIQERNDIPKVESLQGRNFSIEMETGTGKTYVYLRTIFELNKKYGLKKFIIVVPSIAIREGVCKSIETMRKHFQDIYINTPFESYLYESKKLTRIRNFRDSNNIQIMVINIQSFVRDASEEGSGTKRSTNIIYQGNDMMGGRPIDFIRSTLPVIIIDEPQSVDATPKSKRAISQLSPSFILRYSATHRNPYNLLYKLGPIEAYDQRLVKRIEIASVRAEDDYSSAYIRYVRGENKSRGVRGLRAILEIHKKTTKGIKVVQVAVKQGDDLYHHSGRHGPYKQGFIVENIDIRAGRGSVQFNRRGTVGIGESVGGGGDDVVKTMVRETIEQHFQKELLVRGQGVKILSLFFLDRVADYRIYNPDGTRTLGKIGQWFEESYQELRKNPRYAEIAQAGVEYAHGGYFSQDKKRTQWKDTKGKAKDDEDTYSLIMKDKERLLNISEPLKFIFSHTALKEGWDNPNVFQICTLREVGSEVERRQQIGRGLRLPVNQTGERLEDVNLNRLTIIASEGYEEYAQALQHEYEQDLGVSFGIIERYSFSKIIDDENGGIPIGQESSGVIWEELRKNGYIDGEGKIQVSFDPDNDQFKLQIKEDFQRFADQIVDKMKSFLFKNRVVDVKKRKEVQFKKQVFLRADFKELWDKISPKTRYRVLFTTQELIAMAIKKIKLMKKTPPIKISVETADIGIQSSGVQVTATSKKIQYETILPKYAPNIVKHLQERVGLTRDTLVKILVQSERLDEFMVNPYIFIDNVADSILRVIRGLNLRGIEYKKVDHDFWEMRRIERDAGKNISRYIKNLYKIQNQDKALYDYIEFDSEIEKRFARDLDHNLFVKLFVKLPSWFKIDTPVGPYNPDWAFVTEREGEERLYFVRETKSTLDPEKMRLDEGFKIDCGRKHFKEIGVNYNVATSLDEVEF